MAVIPKSIDDVSTTLRNGGAYTMLLSIAMGLLVLFVVPGNNYTSGVLLLTLGVLFITGAIAFLLGSALSRKRTK